MKDIDLSSGDIAFENGDIKMIEGLGAIRQRVLVRLRTRLTEWSYDTTQGLDYFGEIIGQNEFSAARSRILTTLASTPGVAAVTALTVEYDAASREVCFKGTFLVNPAELTDAERAELGLPSLRAPVPFGVAVDVDSGELNSILSMLGSI